MKVFFYYYQCVIKNRIRLIIKKPHILIFNILFIASLLPSFFFFMSLDREPQEEVYIALVTIMTLLIFLGNFFWHLYGLGINLEPTDVNVLHTSPISPGKILIFRKLRDNPMVRFVYSNIFFFAPLFAFNLGLKGEAFMIACIALIVLRFSCVFIGVIWHALFEHKSHTFKKNLTLCVLSVVIVGSIGIAFQIVNSSEPLRYLVNTFNADFLSYIPVIGWYRHLLKSAVYGFGWDFILSSLAILSFLLFLYWIITKRLSYIYYEDANNDVETVKDELKTDNKGKASNNSTCDSYEGIDKAKSHFTMKGAGAIYQKHLLEYGKMGRYLITTRTYIYPILINTAVLFIPDDFIASYDKLQALGVALILSYMFSALSISRAEINKQFIYLIPDYPYKKLYMAVMTDIIKNLIDGIIIFFATTVFFGTNILGAFLCAIIYCAFNVIFHYIDVIAFYLNSRLYNNVEWSGSLRMLFYFVAVMPALIVTIVMLQANFNYFSILLVLTVISVIAAFIISLPAALAIKRPEAA